MMISLFLATLLSVAQTAQDRPSPTKNAAGSAEALSQENRAVIRCSAAFALVGARQARGGESGKQWPEITVRGREFFVVALAGIMEERGLGRDQISQLVRAEAERLNREKQVDAVMPACLLMLESSGV